MLHNRPPVGSIFIQERCWSNCSARTFKVFLLHQFCKTLFCRCLRPTKRDHHGADFFWIAFTFVSTVHLGKYSFGNLSRWVSGKFVFVERIFHDPRIPLHLINMVDKRFFTRQKLVWDDKFQIVYVRTDMGKWSCIHCLLNKTYCFLENVIGKWYVPQHCIHCLFATYDQSLPHFSKRRCCSWIELRFVPLLNKMLLNPFSVPCNILFELSISSNYIWTVVTDQFFWFASSSYEMHNCV